MLPWSPTIRDPRQERDDDGYYHQLNERESTLVSGMPKHPNEFPIHEKECASTGHSTGIAWTPGPPQGAAEEMIDHTTEC